MAQRRLDLVEVVLLALEPAAALLVLATVPVLATQTQDQPSADAPSVYVPCRRNI